MPALGAGNAGPATHTIIERDRRPHGGIWSDDAERACITSGRFAEALTQSGTDHGTIPEVVRKVALSLRGHFLALSLRVHALERQILSAAREDARLKRLEAIPGIGPITASAILATVADAAAFRSARDSAAWIGLTPLKTSSGGKERRWRIATMGDQYLRKLFVMGMTSRVGAAMRNPERADPWVRDVLSRKPTGLATVAMANKAARIVWVVLTRGEDFSASGFCAANTGRYGPDTGPCQIRRAKTSFPFATKEPSTQGISRVTDRGWASG